MVERSEIDGGEADWIEQLRRRGFRMTESRRVVVETLVGNEQILNADEIHHLAAQQYPELGRATVYRTLDLLANIGLIRRVHDEQGCHGYIAVPEERTSGLLVCGNCHRIEDIPTGSMEQCIDDLLEATGFRVSRSSLQLSGLCAACQ